MCVADCNSLNDLAVSHYQRPSVGLFTIARSSRRFNASSNRLGHNSRTITIVRRLPVRPLWRNVHMLRCVGYRRLSYH